VVLDDDGADADAEPDFELVADPVEDGGFVEDAGREGAVVVVVVRGVVVVTVVVETAELDETALLDEPEGAEPVLEVLEAEPVPLLELERQLVEPPVATVIGAEFSLRPVMSLMVKRSSSPAGAWSIQVIEVFVRPVNWITGVVGSTVLSSTLTM